MKCRGRAVQEQYIRAGFEAERIEVIYNGIDPRFLALPRAECGPGVREAMARGVPVIASDPGGPAEMLAHEVNGLPVGPDNERARALAPGDPLEHPEKRQRLGKAARETVEQRFTMQENARRAEQYLLRATRPSGGRPLVAGV